MKNYEITFLVPGNLSAEESDKVLEEVKNFIKDTGGIISNEKRWGSRRLAYTIKKQEQGYYYTLNFDIAGDQLGKLDKMLRLHKTILRHLVTETYKKTGTINFAVEKARRIKAKKTEAIKEEIVVVDEKDRQKKLDEALEKILVD